MRIIPFIFFSVFLLLAMLHQPSAVFSQTDNFDADGLAIDKDQYKIMASEREKNISTKLENGYVENTGIWKDPIKLRKKRIEQWKQMRSRYNPQSLPHKIEE